MKMKGEIKECYIQKMAVVDGEGKSGEIRIKKPLRPYFVLYTFKLNFILIASFFVIHLLSQSVRGDEMIDNNGKTPKLSIGGISINAKFDLAFESREFYANPFSGKYLLTNYHHFVFLSRNKADEKFFFSAEVVDLSFYEFGARLGKNILKFGKILVPFGADPLSHHYYGGLAGFDQKFVPFIWAEHGGVFTSRIIEDIEKKLYFSNDFFIVNAPSGDPSKVFTMQKGEISKFAVGDRLKLGYSRIIGYISTYFTEYKKGYGIFMWGGDISLSYGFIPFIDNLSLKAGFAYMNVKGEKKKIGTYFNFADYLRVDYKLPLNLTFRFLVGSKTMQNYEYPFYDKSTPSGDDETAYNFALIYRRGGFTLQGQYVLKAEAKEQKDDFMRILVVYEF